MLLKWLIRDVLLVCVAVMFVYPDHNVRLGAVGSQLHHPDRRGGVDLPDRRRRDCCCERPSSLSLYRTGCVQTHVVVTS